MFFNVTSITPVKPGPTCRTPTFYKGLEKLKINFFYHLRLKFLIFIPVVFPLDNLHQV